MKPSTYLPSLLTFALIAIKLPCAISYHVELLVRKATLEWKLPHNGGATYLDFYVDVVQPELTVHSVLSDVPEKPVLDNDEVPTL